MKRNVLSRYERDEAGRVVIDLSASRPDDLSNEVVRLAQSHSRAIVWDAKSSPVVADWIQEHGGVAVAAINTTPQAGGFDVLEVLGDMQVNAKRIAASSFRELAFTSGEMDLNGNTLIVGKIVKGWGDDSTFEQPGSYMIAESHQMDSVVFSKGGTVVRTYFKPLF